MIHGRFLVVYVLLGFTLILSAKASAEDGIIANSPEGFARQYQPVFSSWSKSDQHKLQTLLQDFAIPNEWFVKMFGTGQGEELAKQYSDQFNDFKSHISQSFAMASQSGRGLVVKRYGGRSAELFIETTKSMEEEPKPIGKSSPDPLQPLPEIQRFSTQSRVRVPPYGDQNITSWMDSFVYIDGRFRFLGRGAYPFWDDPGVHLADPCAKHGEQSGGKIIRQVEPIYPEEAKESFVRARLTIATDGSVKEVVITDGPEALHDAARKAFAQWQYTPFMNCGKAVEMRSQEHVKFSLR